MVSLLEFVEERNVFRIDVACPLQVTILTCTLKHTETRALAAIDKRVVYVRVVTDFERHEECFNFLSLRLPYSIALSLNFYIRWILKEGCWRPILKD